MPEFAVSPHNHMSSLAGSPTSNCPNGMKIDPFITHSSDISPGPHTYTSNKTDICKLTHILADDNRKTPTFCE